MPEFSSSAIDDAGWVIGVDVGGTKTHVMASRGASTVDVVVPSPSWRHGSLFDDVGNFDRLAATILRAVGGLPAATVVGAHGVDNTAQRERATSFLGARLPGLVTVVNDAVLLAPAMGVTDAVCVIAGTGSAVVGTDAEGGLVTADGYGWLLSDDASAPGLVRDGFVTLLRTIDRDGRVALQDPLARRLLAAFDAADHVELALRFQAAAGEHAWGSLAPQLFAAIDEGSEIAARVVDRAADHLAGLVMAVRGRGALGDDVIAAGGVITAQPFLSNGLRRALHLRDQSLQVHVLDVPPATGALVMARRLTGSAPALEQQTASATTS